MSIADVFGVPQRGGGRYDCFFKLRNLTSTNMRMDAGLSGFPSSVTICSPILPNLVMVARRLTDGLPFGQGPFGLVGKGSVSFVHDKAVSVSQTLRLMNCRPV